MVNLFEHLNFIRPFTCLSGCNSDTITELERKCRRLQTQVFQMEVQWNTVFLPTPPPRPHPHSGLYDHLVITTIFFRPKRKNHCKSFYYFEYLVNATILLLQSGFYCPTVVASTGFHCSRDMILAEIKKNLIVFLTQLRVSFSYGMPISSHMFMLRL